MHFDRFDIVEAYHLFFVNYHEGQTSRKYERLCKMREYYNTSSTFFFHDCEYHLSENALEIYENLVKREESNK